MLETSDFDENCFITGTINFKPTSMPGIYTCNFVSEQICKWEDGQERLFIEVQQSCAAQKVGKQVAIKSKVVRVVERRPEIPDPDRWYLADNFIVTLTENGLEMLGRHYDEQRQLKARFWRDRDLLSFLFKPWTKPPTEEKAQNG